MKLGHHDERNYCKTWFLVVPFLLMLMLGVTQRSEMRRHINIFVQEHFPDISEMDASFYPGDQALSLIMYHTMLLHQHTHIDQELVLSLVWLS